MASRSKRFITGLITGYGSIATNIVFTMASIPLALHYLDREQFGLWVLALQMIGYLGLIDVGINAAVSRFIADHKSDVNGGEYGSLLLTAASVFAIQGLIVLCAGVGLAFLAPRLFAIPSDLSGLFTRVLLILSCTTGLTFLLRPVGAPLWAFQRLAIINGCASFQLILQLALMWFFFKIGMGLYSLVLSQISPLLINYFVFYWVCKTNGYYPSSGHWGRPRWNIFKQVFAFGRDSLLLALGGQLVNATQITIISRILGLEQAATYSIATKTFGMAQQLLQKVISTAAPGLTEMFVLNSLPGFRQRYRQIIAFTLSTAGFASMVIAGCNSAFIEVWTGGAVSWSLTSDFLLGIFAILTSLSYCFISVFGIIKNLRSVRFIYLIEGLVFVPCAIFGAKWLGIEGVLASSILVHFFITLAFTFRSAGRVLGSFRHMASSLLCALSLTGLACFVAWLGHLMDLTPTARLLVGVLPVIAGAWPIWRLMLPAPIKDYLKSTIWKGWDRLSQYRN